MRFVGILLFASAAWAQPVPGQPPGFTCVANAGNPVIVRTEGITELVGDLLLQCTGGQPTPKGQPVPQTNLTITLNTNITSRLLSGGFIDALLLIDDPFPKAPIPSDAKPLPDAPPQNVCMNLAGCPTVATGDGHLAPNAATIYVAHQVAPGAVEWDGVPIDAPGTTGVRLIRITNVRANAAQLGLSSTLIPTQVVMFVSITGSQSFTINNPQQSVAYIQQGLIVGNTTTGLQQCMNLNSGAGQNGFNVTSVATLNFKESFANAFKGRTLAVAATTDSTPPLASQNVPGIYYTSETAFFDNSLSNLSRAADSATRLFITIPHIGPGTGNGPFILAPLTVPLFKAGATTPSTPPAPPAGVAPGVKTGVLRLVATDKNGGFSGYVIVPAIPGTLNGLPMAETQYIAISSAVQDAAAVYEVVNADPAAVEEANIPIGVAFISSPAQNIPALGTSTVNLSFAPTSSNFTASSTDAIPRFAMAAVQTRSLFTTYSCNQLFSPVLANGTSSPTQKFSVAAGSSTNIQSVIPLTTIGPPVNNLSIALQILNGPGAPSATPGVPGPARDAAPAVQPWLTATLNQTSTPADLVLIAKPQGLAAGTYSATVTVNTPGATSPSLSIPVTLVVAGTRPIISVAGITNSASNKTTAVTPGMMTTIYGSNFGPAALNTQRFLENKGTLATTMSDTRVIFDGQYLAPMVYAANGQISAMVPYEIAGNTTTQIVVEYKGLQSLAITVPVTDAAPAIFTADSSGSGQAAALNLDFSFNNSTNPVARGSFIQLFGTGEGQTKPAGKTGGVNTNVSALPAPALPVSAKVGNVEVTPAYFGGLFGQLNGFFQVNLPIPDSVGTGNVPVVVRVNGKESPPVTISVK